MLRDNDSCIDATPCRTLSLAGLRVGVKVRLGPLKWAALVTICAVASPAQAGPSQATKDRCTAYAQRAVEQYQLMKSHPQCQANTDPITWQDSYDNHYNGCLLFPESMSKLAQAARENHLQACGALTSNANAAGPDATSNAAGLGDGGTVGVDPAQGAGPAPEAAAGESLQDAPAAAGPGQCSPRPPPFFYSLNPKPAGAGTNPRMVGGTLTFTFIDPAAPAKREKVTYRVRRPAFWLAYLKCTHGNDDPNWNYWVWVADSGREAKYFAMGGLSPTVTVWSIAPEGAAQLLGN